MRKSVLAVCAVLILLTATPALSGDDAPFFDMANCAMCESLLKDPDLMPNLGWEHYNLAEGMEAPAAKLMAGEDVPICNFCQATMGLMMEGASHEVVPFEGGTMMLMTSNDPQTVKHIHEYCDTINAELKKMQAPTEG